MPDIAIFVLDTLRKGSFDRHFDWLPGTRFDDVYAPSHYTVPVHGGLFTGQYPSSIGVGAKHELFDCSEQSIVEQLRDSGYETTAYSANGLLTADRKFDRGFDNFETSWRVELMDEDVFGWSRAVKQLPNGPFRDIHAILQCISSDCDTLRSLKLGYSQKFADHDGGRDVLSRAQAGEYADTNFLFVNLMEAHSPYRAPDDYEMPSVDPVEPETILEGDVDLSGHHEQYEVAVEWLSDLYQDIFETIKSDFDYIFTLSDHGELFGEHGGRAHFHGVFPELVHVPLCVTGLDEENCVTETPRSLLDVHKTIGELTEVSVDSEGVDLRESPEDRDLFVEYHGFREMRLDGLRERGFSESEIAEFDTPLVGHIADGVEYEYQKATDKLDLEDSIDRRRVIEERQEKLIQDVSRITSMDESISEEALEQLRNLGYA